MIRYEAMKAIVEAKGYHATRFVFDCGESIEIRQDHLLIVTRTRECGDIETATEAVIESMVSMGLLTGEDFKNAPH